MKVKTFVTVNGSDLDSQVNAFLEDEKIEVVEIQFQCGTFGLAAMVIYNE